MLKIKKRFKPRFKKYAKSKVRIPNKQKILSLKKKKMGKIHHLFFSIYCKQEKELLL